ncbi:hypothetical protein AV530_002206 [Patagioenas fasciata monilis]|uniref:Uncharacterized protein n=1 Tax=Patagioenas fasciata monilis TaxID=372326 RepID=A0A1V4K5H7_PATFA|nr:hypothetical protein AV530_002206 [Patagioenas fasciata monilis]
MGCLLSFLSFCSHLLSEILYIIRMNRYLLSVTENPSVLQQQLETRKMSRTTVLLISLQTISNNSTDKAGNEQFYIINIWIRFQVRLFVAS